MQSVLLQYPNMGKSSPRINTYYDDDEAFIRSYNRIHSPNKPKTEAQIIKSYWNSMNSRVKKGIYLEKGIKVLWSFSEFNNWFESNWEIFHLIKEAGEIPSIDRIDSNGNYEVSNCRMIPNSVNSALGEVNAIIGRMKTLQEFLKSNQHWLTSKKP